MNPTIVIKSHIQYFGRHPTSAIHTYVIISHVSIIDIQKDAAYNNQWVMTGARMELVDRKKLYAQVGSRIRSAREARRPKVTQSELAASLGVERTSITNIENGTQRATLLTLYGVARQLQVPLPTLLPDPNDPAILEAKMTDVAEVTVGRQKRTVPTAVKSIFEKV